MKQITKQMEQKLDAMLVEGANPAIHSAVKEFLSNSDVLECFTEEQLHELLDEDAIAVHDQNYFGEYLEEFLDKAFSEYAPGEYDKVNDFYRTKDGKYIVEQQLF